MTLSGTYLKWNELIAIIAQIKCEYLTSDFNGMNFFERCIYLNLKPVLLARHFQYSI